MWKDLLLDIAYGYKRIFIALGLAMLACAIVWGVISAGLTIAGTIDFQWWNIPCWVIDVSALAGCLGQNR